jgi:hypothetical protein
MSFKDFNLKDFNLKDFNLYAVADADSESGTRGLVRTTRRAIKRCWFDRKTIMEPRIFCQNIGGCGSTYIVQLLSENGVENVFHEKTPDLESLAAQHYERPIAKARLVRLLRYTRHNAFFEANNRLFAMSNEIAAAFPKTKFIHLFRDPRDSIRGNMSKPNVDDYARTNSRLQSSLGGPSEAPPFEKFCHHWYNANQRIVNDLKMITTKTGQPFLTLRFDDLIKGRLDGFERFTGLKLANHVRPPVNQRATRTEGRFPAFEAWSKEQQSLLGEICGPLFESLNRQADSCLV